MSIVGGSKPWYNTAHSNNGMRKALIVMFWTLASLAWIKMSLSAAASSVCLSAEINPMGVTAAQISWYLIIAEQSEQPIIFYRCVCSAVRKNFPDRKIFHAKTFLNSCTEETWLCVQVIFSRRPGPVVEVSKLSFWIIQTVSVLFAHILDCPGSFWVIRAVFRLSGQFLGYPDCFGPASKWIFTLLHNFLQTQRFRTADTLTKFFWLRNALPSLWIESSRPH